MSVCDWPLSVVGVGALAAGSMQVLRGHQGWNPASPFYSSRTPTRIHAKYDSGAQEGPQRLEEEVDRELPPWLPPQETEGKGHGRVQVTTYGGREGQKHETF